MLPALSSADAGIWLLDCRVVDDAQLPRFVAWLGAAEAARHARFVRAQRQRQFLLGRALLRVALGQMLELAPDAIELEERPGQAPRLLAPASGPHFSISHSGHWVACALSSATPLGLDIEVRDARRDVLALARQAFGEAVTAHLAALPPDERLLAFYQRWSDAEARYKLGQEAGACAAVAHPDLSIVLCSAAPLARPPQWKMASLAAA